MDYAQAVKFHEEIKAYGSILGLDSMRALMRQLGDIWRHLPAVHVAGTNGKGSVCCFAASALKEAGYRVGQYSSPAVFHLRECCQINGQWISEEEYASCMQDVSDACRRMQEEGLRHPTVFEAETALAFLWFYRQKCDIVLLEAGMGGSTDATNVIEHPLCSVFTSIGMDHMQFLGNSIVEITRVKAGIIKRGCPVVSAARQGESGRILRECASALNASFHEALPMEEAYAENGALICRHPVLGELRLSMGGSYQENNASLAISVIGLLRQAGYSVSDSQLRRGIERAVWPGRFERISFHPPFYIDGAHNPDAALELKKSLLAHFGNKKKIGIMGVMADKPYKEMARILLPCFDQIFTVTPDNPRALCSLELAKEITACGGQAHEAADIKDAVRLSYAAARKESGVAVAFGSLFYLKEVKDALFQLTGQLP